MAVQWQTFPIEFKGGLISNMSPLQQGLNAIGSATILQNMEPDRQGGYTKMRGYQKYTDREIPGTGKVVGLHVVSGGRAVVARKVDADAVTELTTATSTVNGAVSSSANVALDNNTATATINGAISNSTTLVLDRILSYTAVTGTASASGQNATFDVTNTNGTYSVTINAAGTGYVQNETITILGTSLGGATTANDATITVNTVDGSGVIQTASISGTGASFGTITKGMVITGTDISGTVTVRTVTDLSLIHI